MVYLYVDIGGNVGKSEVEPTAEDIRAIKDGQLTVIRLELDKFGNVFPEEMDPDMDDEPWFDVPKADVDSDGGVEYHYVS